MEIKSMSAFLSYYERTRLITNKVIQVVPKEKLDWTYAHGKFTIADLIRHIAAIERNLFMEVIQGNLPAYKGCGKNLADGNDEVLSYFNDMHNQSIQILKSIKDIDLERKIKALDGKELTVGSFLRALIVHEIHHRGALCIYLNMLNIETPPIIGFTEEQVIEVSSKF